MRARVLRPLVEADSRDRAVRRGYELDAEGHRTGIVDGDRARRGVCGKECLRRQRIVHADRDIAGGGGLSIGDRVGETGWTHIVAVRHEADGLCAGIVADRAAGRVADTRDGQRKAVRIRVVGEQGRSRDRQRRVFGRDQAADIVGDGSCRSIEYDINPVVAGVETAGGKDGAAAIGVNAVAAAGSAGRRGQRSTGEGGVEVIGIDGIVPAAGEVGSDICRSRGNGHRVGEIDLLPSACALIGEAGAGEQGSG